VTERVRPPLLEVVPPPASTAIVIRVHVASQYPWEGREEQEEALLNHGCLIAPFRNMMLVCPATTERQAACLVAAFEDVAQELCQPS
jgi:hypothetical protein